MAPEIMMYSGKYFNFMSPETSEFTIEDVALALSRINRYTGHTRFPYSVAQHCVLGSLQFKDPKMALEFLLHDTSEAFMGDVATPLKLMLPEYQVIEKRVEKAVAERFGTTFPMLPETKEADLRMLATEVIQLMPPAAQQWEILRGVQPYKIDIDPWSPEHAEWQYKRRFKQLTGKGR